MWQVRPSVPPDSNGKTSVKVPADAGHDVISLRGDVISSRSQTPVQSADSYDAATFESDSHAGSTHLNTAARAEFCVTSRFVY